MPLRVRVVPRPVQAALGRPGRLHRDLPGAEASVLRQLRSRAGAADNVLVHVRRRCNDWPRAAGELRRVCPQKEPGRHFSRSTAPWREDDQGVG